LNKETIKIKN